MSEHIGVKGKVEFYHLPYREYDGFTACKNRECCEKGDFTDKLIIEFHEGFLTDWMQVICGRCKKTIWVANLNGRRKQVKNNKKCEFCKKPTNQYDCFYYGSCGIYKKGKTYYICSKKCDKEINKEIDKLKNSRRKNDGK